MANLIAAGQAPTLLERAHQDVEKTLEGASAVKRNGEAFYSALQFGNYAFMGAECAFGIKKPISFMAQKISGGISVIDAFDLFSSLNYWINGEFKEDWDDGKKFQVLGSAALSTATVGGFVLWLGELGFMDLGSIAAGLGSIPVIGGVFQGLAELGLGSIVGGAVTIGYGFLAADAIQNIIHGDKSEKRTKGILDLISSVSYVALYVLLFIPGITIPVVVVFGVVASGFGVSSFLYKHYNKEAFN